MLVVIDHFAALLFRHAILLHVDPAETALSTWTLAPSVFIGCAALIGIYLAAVRSRLSRQALWYVAGVLVLLFALISPLDKIGELYLFSVHMVQHLLLLLVVPPLLLLGIPSWLARKLIAHPVVRGIERILRRPVVAWLIGLGTVWIWHIPALYNAALLNHDLHIVEHLTFMAAAVIFAWPFLSPIRHERLSPPAMLIYTMAAGVLNTLLSILLAYIPIVLYDAYANPGDPFGLLPVIREEWGITARLDQQIAGFLMAVPGGLFLSVGVLVILMHWFHEEESYNQEQEQEVVGNELSASR